MHRLWRHTSSTQIKNIHPLRGKKNLSNLRVSSWTRFLPSGILGFLSQRKTGVLRYSFLFGFWGRDEQCKLTHIIILFSLPMCFSCVLSARLFFGWFWYSSLGSYMLLDHLLFVQEGDMVDLCPNLPHPRPLAPEHMLRPLAPILSFNRGYFSRNKRQGLAFS